MAHGMPDDSDVESDSNVSKSLDLAELAVRLGALPSYDRRGDVVYWNDFAAGLGILTADTAAGSLAQRLGNVHGIFSGVSLEMQSWDIEDDYAFVQFTVVLLETKTLGLEVLYTWGHLPKSVRLNIEVTVAGTRFLYYVDVLLATGEVLVYNALGAWELAGVFGGISGNTEWLQSAKLVVDLGNLRYARITLNGQTCLLTAYAPYQFSYGGNNAVVAEMRIRATALDYAEAYLAGVILTQNEPL